MSSNPQLEEILQMEFAGVEAQDSDIPSMSRLLNQLIRESGVSPTELAKVLVSQNYIGSVLKTSYQDDGMEDDEEEEEDDPVFAITSIVNITQRQEPVVKDIIKFLQKSIRDPNVKIEKGNKVFEEFISSNGVSQSMTTGLLIKERMLNMPVNLLHPALQCLLSEVEESVKKNMPYKFTHFMFWAKMYLNGENFCHYDAENSWFDENCLEYFSYPLKYADTVLVENEQATTGAPQFRRVYIMEYSKLDDFIEYVESITGM